MSKKFTVPPFYKSSFVSSLKQTRAIADPKRKNLAPSVVDCGPVRFFLTRHFGFCYGVEQAIEIAYRALDENAGKRVFLLSEMIHNPLVNRNLEARGVHFLMRTDGSELVPLESLTKDDVVIVPAFGTTLEIQERLSALGINPYSYDTTCPFVEKVWKRAEQLGRRGFSVVVHGKRDHEETRATVSHSRQSAPTVVVRDINEAAEVAAFIRGERCPEEFADAFKDSVSPGFDPQTDLQRIGVVNQTTMLATETQAIIDLFRDAMKEVYGAEKLAEHFADTADTLCYATYENQSATRALLQSTVDLAFVVGGYNSSNTSHLVELLEEAMPVYFISGPSEILSDAKVRHFDLHQRSVIESDGWLSRRGGGPVNIGVTSGASCPDSTVEGVLRRILEFFPGGRSLEAATVTGEWLNGAPQP